MEDLYEKTKFLIDVCQEPEKLSESELVRLRLETAEFVSVLAQELVRQIDLCKLTPGIVSPEIVTINKLILDLGKARGIIAQYLAKN